MAFFDSFTDSLKQKWLQFFQANRDWIILHMTVESVHTPDGGKRPSSYLILGVVNALEPKLAQLMFPFAKLNPDADTLIDVLDLNFDPDILLGNRVSSLVEQEMFYKQPTSILEEKTVAEIEEKFTESTKYHKFQEETNTQEFAVENKSTGTSTEEMNFGEISGLEETGFDALGGSEEVAFGESANLDDDSFDVVSDIWGEEASETLEELPSDFNESEMDRLFPNN